MGVSATGLRDTGCCPPIDVQLWSHGGLHWRDRTFGGLIAIPSEREKSNAPFLSLRRDAVARLVVAKTYFDLSDALVAKLVLEAHGFVAVLFDWHVGSVNWSYMFALNGIRLCTLDGSLADALSLLDDGLEAEDPNLVTTVRVIDILIVLFAFFNAGLPYPVRRKRYRNI
jgi:hypothetical protein